MLKKIINRVFTIKHNEFIKSKWYKKMPLCPCCYGTGYIVHKGDLIKCFVCDGTGRQL